MLYVPSFNRQGRNHVQDRYLHLPNYPTRICFGNTRKRVASAKASGIRLGFTPSCFLLLFHAAPPHSANSRSRVNPFCRCVASTRPQDGTAFCHLADLVAVLLAYSGPPKYTECHPRAHCPLMLTYVHLTLFQICFRLDLVICT